MLNYSTLITNIKPSKIIKNGLNVFERGENFLQNGMIFYFYYWGATSIPNLKFLASWIMASGQKSLIEKFFQIPDLKERKWYRTPTENNLKKMYSSSQINIQYKPRLTCKRCLPRCRQGARLTHGT